MNGYVPDVLDKSRFCRRLHRRADLLLTLFYARSTRLKHIVGAADYRLDSFPAPLCHNMRISRCHLVRDEAFRGYRRPPCVDIFKASKCRCSTLEGIPVEFCLVPGEESDDVKAPGKPALDVAPESVIWMDAGYRDYAAEDDLFEAALISAKVQRKKNSKRKDEPWNRFLKEYMRKAIETDFSEIKAKMPETIHDVTLQGFLLKVRLFAISKSFYEVTAL